MRKKDREGKQGNRICVVEVKVCFYFGVFSLVVVSS